MRRPTALETRAHFYSFGGATGEMLTNARRCEPSACQLDGARRGETNRWRLSTLRNYADLSVASGEHWRPHKVGFPFAVLIQFNSQ